MRAVLFIAVRQLWARKMLNGIAVLGVMLGVTTLVGITGIMHGFQQKFLDTLLAITPHVVVLDDKLGAREAIARQRLGGGPAVVVVRRQSAPDRRERIARPDETLVAIRQLDGVSAASGLVVGSAVASVGAKELPVEVRGIDPLVQDAVTPIAKNIVSGDLHPLASAVDGALLGRTLAEQLGARVGDTVSCASARGERMSLRVVGVFETRIAALDKTRIYVSQRVGQTLLGRGQAIDRVEVRLDDPDRAPEVASALESMFGYDAESWQEANASMLGVFVQQNTITGFIIGAVLVVGGFGILAIQIMIVLEKRRDIALLKSVGYTSRDVLVMFLFEGAVVALLGAALGSGAGHLVLSVLRNTKSAAGGGLGIGGGETFAIHETLQMYVVAFSFAVLVGVLASLIPAWRAARVEPVDVLRGMS